MYRKYHLPLNEGDLIVIAYSNKLYKAVFVRYGKKNNMHFYLLYRAPFILEQILDGKKPQIGTVDFINTHAEKRVVKISYDVLTKEEKEHANIICNYLKKNTCN